MEVNNVKCLKCGSSFNRMFLMGKQGNADVCPVCGGELQDEDEHPDWITWYYYKDIETNCFTLRDEAIDLDKWVDTQLIKEFKAPPRDSKGSSEQAKEILRTYVPDAFVNKTPSETTVKCPYCGCTDIKIVPKKFSLLTGFATNKLERVCAKCMRKF
jgi:DNA-directed RNA polymerase subunit RPC12/RpoP